MFELPALTYEFGALEPHIDAKTMEIHHGKHHQAYVNNLNNAVKGNAAEGKSLEELMASISKHSMAIRNNGGGHWNHSLFWTLMSPTGGGAPEGKLAADITATFGSFETLKEQFNTAAATRFGSGWAWLLVHDGKPLMDIAEVKGTPILALDVWEHAYYLHYQNRRPDYINAWWNVVDWKKVDALYQAAH